MDIQWYPGHMKKALRQMSEDAKLIDLVIEILDARVPLASHNPDIDTLFNGKARIVFLNKADLADENETKKWIARYRDNGVFAVSGDARDRSFKKRMLPEIEKASEKKRARDKKRGIKPRPIRSIVVGVPNGGKSTFINSFSGRASAKTGNKPGVTKGKQWIRLSKDLELLDTPGILWPKFEDPLVGMHLAAIGSIREEIIGLEELAVRLADEIEGMKSHSVREYYTLNETDTLSDILSEIAYKRGCLKAGGEADTLRAAKLFLDDFRAAKIGRFTLERVKP